MSLSICGILLLGGASYQSSFTAEGMARAWEFPYGNFKITNKVFYDDSEEMYSIAKSEIQNPLTNKLREQILNISGVEDIKLGTQLHKLFLLLEQIYLKGKRIRF